MSLAKWYYTPQNKEDTFLIENYIRKLGRASPHLPELVLSILSENMDSSSQKKKKNVAREIYFFLKRLQSKTLVNIC